jgi:signal transduction histidine kinase
MKRLLLASYRLRIIFRSVFLLLALATLGLALTVLQQEKQLSYNNYQSNFKKTQNQISATLRHPAGQLALLNPPSNKASNKSTLSPLLLPFSALDFDDQHKVQQAIALSGCLMQFAEQGSLCLGIGNNPWAGGFIYVAGSFNSAALVSHPRGQFVRDEAHRILVTIRVRGQEYQWLAPFEEELNNNRNPANTTINNNNNANNFGIKGRWTGFWKADVNKANAKPVRDFRGWAWQKAVCNDIELDGKEANCTRNTFFSLRLPIAVWQEALFEKKRPEWPPQDLTEMDVRVQVLAPHSNAILLDSQQTPSATPFSLNDLSEMLLPGETLSIRKASEKQTVLQLVGKIEQEAESWNLLTRLIRRIPVEEFDTPLESKSLISTPLDNYEIHLKGDVRSISKSLSVVATRVSWFVGGMLLALILAWLLIEISIIRRITLLSKRARILSRSMKGAGDLDQLDVSDLRSTDELGILASALHDLLRRVKQDVERETIRAEQEKQMWHAVGHEIMSPLQSLLVIHPKEEDQSHRYLSRMQQAIKVLYGHASPSEAFQSTVLNVGEINLSEFLNNVAENAACVGIPNVHFQNTTQTVFAKADEYSLEDVITHILNNAQRYRPTDSPIHISLQEYANSVGIRIHNQGPAIPEDMLTKIFEYGVSDHTDALDSQHRGQGLFVAKTYMSKMGGTLNAENRPNGVAFILNLPRRGGAV